MLTINYIVISFDGDYAILKDENKDENKVALALLPSEIKEGSRVLFENFEYTIV